MKKEDQINLLTENLLGAAIFKNVYCKLKNIIDDFRVCAKQNNIGKFSSSVYAELINSKPYEILSFKNYLYNLLALDMNPISLCFLNGRAPQQAVLNRAKQEYDFFMELGNINLSYFENADYFTDNNSKEVLNYYADWDCGISKPFDLLISDYKTKGCGVFASAVAFSWDSFKKELAPINNIATVTVNDLKEYKEEKQQIRNNTVSFLKDLPACNVLLYGDRGTGKSSTIHAILNENSKDGLRLIQIDKNQLCDLPFISAAISDVKFKFILFIDDLSFENDENDFSQIKAALEGSIHAKHKNMLIYVTTNRRHLIKESHDERGGDDVHALDTMQGKLALADRFGLVITFQNPSKHEYLTILTQILKDRNITLEQSKIELYGERYAIKKGGRSPRVATQLADLIESAVRQNQEIDF